MSREQALSLYADVIAAQPLFEGFEATEVSDLLKRCAASIVVTPDGHPLNSIDEAVGKPPRLGCLLMGSAQHVKYDVRGNRSILESIHPGSLLGTVHLFTKQVRHMTTMLAAGECVCLYLDIASARWDDAVGKSLQVKLYFNILIFQTDFNQRLLWKADILSQRTIEDKVLTYVAYERLRNGGSSFDIPYNEQQLADYLFVSRSSLCLVLSNLKNREILQYRNRHITIFSEQ